MNFRSRGARASAPLHQRSKEAASMYANPSSNYRTTRPRDHVRRGPPVTSHRTRRLPDSMPRRRQPPPASQPSLNEIILVTVEPNLKVPLRRVPDVLKALAVDYYDTPKCPCCGELSHLLRNQSAVWYYLAHHGKLSRRTRVLVPTIGVRPRHELGYHEEGTPRNVSRRVSQGYSCLHADAGRSIALVVGLFCLG
jgi:hypothetical protein